MILAESIDIIVNFVAQMHIVKMFGDSLNFTHSNVFGHVLLEACRKAARHIKKFVHVNTDEVYSETKGDVSSTKIWGFEPTNPDIATKAGA